MPSPLRGALALALPLALAAPLAAQEAGFALEVSPPADQWAGLRLNVAVFGAPVEPAAGYVRGCPGFVADERAGVQLQVSAEMDVLTLTSADPAVQGMVLGTPDGFFRCVVRGADGLIAARLDRAAPGRYRVWLATDEGAALDSRLIVADRPVSALELLGLDTAALGAPRAGTHVFAPDGPRQVLAQGATLFPESPMDPLDPAAYCPGYGRFDAADAVLTLTAAQQNLAVFARADRDLTIAVLAPDGTVLCNDDTFELNPAVIFSQAPAGDYLIFVGAFSQGGEGSFDLYAGVGAPSWTGQPFVAGEPRAGRFSVDAAAGAAPQVLTRGPVVAGQELNLLPTGGFCPGFGGIDAPDAVVTLTGPADLFSLHATSETDLVLAVRGPDGLWLCNDDTFALNPAVVFYGARGGEYLVYVGAYNPGAEGTYTLTATLGEPDWSGAPAQGGAAGPTGASPVLNTAAPPMVGVLDFGPATRIDPRLIFDIQPSTIEARGLAEGCVGFITPEAPDVVIRTAPALPQLMVYAVSDADGVLVVVGPDGTIHCNDDFEGLNPGVMIPNPAAGDYAVFAGTYGGNGGLSTLGVTIASPQWVMDREH